MSSVFATQLPGPTPLWHRALQSSQSQTSSTSSFNSSLSQTTTSTTTANTSPLFQDPASVTPPSASSSQSQAISKVALEYVLVAALALIFGGILIQRHTTSTSTDVPVVPRRFPRTTGLTEVPPYPYSRRTRALDTDVAGRRVLDTVNVSDHDGYIGDKDVLPAYDNCGGPPQYREVALELNVMPPTQHGNVVSGNSSGPGNVGDFHPPAGETDDTAAPRDPSSLPGSSHGSADVVRLSDCLAIPAAVHARQ